MRRAGTFLGVVTSRNWACSCVAHAKNDLPRAVLRGAYLGSHVLLLCIEQQLLQSLVKVYPQTIGHLHHVPSSGNPLICHTQAQIPTT